MMRTFSTLGSLPLTVDSYALEGLSREVSSDFIRHTTLVRLQGDDHEGVGEDVTYDAGDQKAFQSSGAALPLAGRFDLRGFSALVGELDLFPSPPSTPASRYYRRWAFESAALDLALRQAHRSLTAQLKIEPSPVRFVVSTRLGKPPTSTAVRRWLDLYPETRFKLDATSSWDDALIEQLVATHSVDSLDFKGAYRGTIVDQAPDVGLYARVARAFPEAWLEDPALTPATEAALAGNLERVTWDAPVHSVEDISGLRYAPRMVNIKPSRFGSLEALFDAFDYCREHEIGMYGGGQFELGPGRGHIQYLAALFHADAPNDVAPGGYNQPEPRAGLPTSPLPPRVASTGFRWIDD